VKRLLAFAALAALISGCSKVSTSSGAAGGEHAWTKPGVLRVSIQSEPKNLNTLLSSNTTDSMIDSLITDPIISADAKGNLVPVLAETVPTVENGGISKDGLTVTYHLRKGIKWSDGAPLTSKDIKFSWQSMMSKDNNVVSRHGFDEVKSIDTPDDTTFILHLTEKFAPIVVAFFGPSDAPTNIAPEHILSKYPNINQIPYNNEPIGSGPYKLAEWVKGDHITLVANPNYFQGAPGLKQIIIRIIPDENTSLNLLRTHDIDWMFEPSYSTYAALKTMADVTTHFNDVNGYEGVQLNTSHAPLNNLQVRRAIAYAIDKKQLLDSLTFGQQKLATEDLPDWMWAYNPNVTVYQHDPAKAKQLLEAEGYKPGADGIMTKNGEKLSLLMVTNGSNATRKKASVLMQSSLRQVGIDVQIKYFDGATLFAPAPIGILQGGKFDLGISGWFAGVDPDNSSNYMCKNIPPGGYNYTRYCSAKMDAAQVAALTNYDQPTRKKAYAQIEELLATDVPQIFFWWDRQAQAINPDFKNFDPNPVTESWNAYQWSI
jgi:peptide/nickel transport system substrate-binding protein